jgi:5-methylcytosine-specific restriction endonuclease McrA
MMTATMSQKVLHRPVLVLNKNYTPINTCTVKEAIGKLHATNPKGEPLAYIIEPESYQRLTWEDWAALKPSEEELKLLSTSEGIYKTPEIILVTQYEKVRPNKVKFNRRTLAERDNHQCQYCGKKLKGDEWSIDHVVPKAKGGMTTWTNCVIACVPCNAKKADRGLHECGLKLLKEPKKPQGNLFTAQRLKHRIKSWDAFLGAIYMEVELENDNPKE